MHVRVIFFFNLSISVLHLNKFRLTSKNGLFLQVFCHFHTKTKLCLHIRSCFIVMWLFSAILVPVELFLTHFQRYVLTGSSVSNPSKSTSVSGENGKSLALHVVTMFDNSQSCLKRMTELST